MPARLTKIVNGVRRFVSRNGRLATTGCRSACCTAGADCDIPPDEFGCTTIYDYSRPTLDRYCLLSAGTQHSLTMSGFRLFYTDDPDRPSNVVREIAQIEPLTLTRFSGHTEYAGPFVVAVGGVYFAEATPFLVTPMSGSPFIGLFCVEVAFGSIFTSGQFVATLYGAEQQFSCPGDAPSVPCPQVGGFLARIIRASGGGLPPDGGFCDTGVAHVFPAPPIAQTASVALDRVRLPNCEYNPLQPDTQPGTGAWSCEATFALSVIPTIGVCPNGPPPVTGACCSPQDGCIGVVTASDCAARGGTWLGDGVPCSSCPPPVTGACCTTRNTLNNPQAICTERTRKQCNLARGQYRGDGTTCTPTACPQTEACCIGGNQCVDATPSACRLQFRGTSQGPGTRCTTTGCSTGGGDGACCINGNCVKATASDCIANGGTYQGDGTDCAGVSCPPQVGSCCVPGNPPECFNVTFQACQDKLGSWAPGTCANRVCVGINPASTSLDILRGFVSS